MPERKVISASEPLGMGGPLLGTCEDAAFCAAESNAVSWWKRAGTARGNEPSLPDDPASLPNSPDDAPPNRPDAPPNPPNPSNAPISEPGLCEDAPFGAADSNAVSWWRRAGTARGNEPSLPDGSASLPNSPDAPSNRPEAPPNRPDAPPNA